MPFPRLVRLAAAGAVLTALAGASIMTASTATAAGVTDDRDASCTTGDTRAICASPDSLLDVRIGDVHPTQPSLGYDEVYYKLGRYSAALSKDKINKKFDDWCEANGQKEAKTVPAGATITDPSSFTCKVAVGAETAATIEPMKTVVIGPKGTLYLTDGHHTLTSFAEDSGLDVHVRLRVLGNLSGLSESAFWTAMQDNKWVWLRDVNGKSITPAQLPQNVGLANFQDDRYRSVMYFARDIGFSADGAVPFQEFYWGSWLRGRTDLPVATWDQDDWAGSLALVKQITEAQVALAPDAVVDAQTGYTASQMSAFTSWNAGAAESDGEWGKLSQPYSAAKPGKLAYMVGYRATLPTPTAPSAPDAPSLAVSGSTVTATWNEPATGGSAITGYTVTLSDGTSQTVGADVHSAVFEDVAPGTYTATVTATNAVGNSDASAASVAVTVAGTPTDPTDPTNPTDPTDPTNPTDPGTVHGSVSVSGPLVAGGAITVRGSGFAPSVDGIRVELHSDPVLLGTVRTDADGAFTLAATIPNSTPAGTHSVVVVVNGVEVGSSTITVAASTDPAAVVGGSTPGQLAFTGASGLSAAGIAALVLLLAGTGVIVLRRRGAGRQES